MATFASSAMGLSLLRNFSSPSEALCASPSEQMEEQAPSLRGRQEGPLTVTVAARSWAPLQGSWHSAAVRISPKFCSIGISILGF